jgi:hypothetical protein
MENKPLKISGKLPFARHERVDLRRATNALAGASKPITRRIKNDWETTKSRLNDGLKMTQKCKLAGETKYIYLQVSFKIYCIFVQ